MEKIDGSKPDGGRQLRLIRLQEVKYRTGLSTPMIYRRMRARMGELLETFISVLPMHLDCTLGRRVPDVRPRWGNGTSQLVALMLTKRIRAIGSVLDR